MNRMVHTVTCLTNSVFRAKAHLWQASQAVKAWLRVPDLRMGLRGGRNYTMLNLMLFAIFMNKVAHFTLYLILWHVVFLIGVVGIFKKTLIGHLLDFKHVTPPLTRFHRIFDPLCFQHIGLEAVKKLRA